MPFQIPLFAAIAPFILWPVELILPFPYVIEELVKLLLILPLLALSSKSQAIKLALLVGIIFAFSETVLYLFNIALVGRPQDLFIRLIVTSTLHATTCLIMVSTGLIYRWLIILGLTIAILIHYLFNSLAF